MPDATESTWKVDSPQPLVVGVEKLLSLKNGNTIDMVSGFSNGVLVYAILSCSATLSANRHVIDVGAPVTGFQIKTWVCWNAEVGTKIAVDFATVVGMTFVAFASVNETLR